MTLTTPSHTCSNYHYGNRDAWRQCCVHAARTALALAQKVAITYSHPAADDFKMQWERLTDSERASLGSRDWNYRSILKLEF